MAKQYIIQNDLALLPATNGADSKHTPLAHERLVRWAADEWQRRYPAKDALIVWAEGNCGNRQALKRVKVGRKLKDGGKYLGFTPLICPVSTPISAYYMPVRQPIFTDGVGAFIFHLERRGVQYDVLFVSDYVFDADNYRTIQAIALVPPDALAVFSTFEDQMNIATGHFERIPRIHVVGGPVKAFEAKTPWEEVILAESLKDDIRNDMESFFEGGVEIYKQLGLPPFRKLLLVGPPGTGKTTLCEAMAKLALDQKRVVVYVSASDRGGATFEKIYNALRIVAGSKHPVLLIVEELDIYLNEEDKSQILNVLDGMESPDNPRGALLLATTNYPEVIDERIAKRPGRIDRVIYIPPIQDESQAERMLRRYMGAQYRDEHRVVIPQLINRTGAFVREVALYARMLSANSRQPEVSTETLQQSVKRLVNQLTTGDDLLPRRPIGFQRGDDRAAGFAAVVGTPQE
jgi:energy-coupling factor transporter ATP-binding protein EcfA2